MTKEVAPMQSPAAVASSVSSSSSSSCSASASSTPQTSAKSRLLLFDIGFAGGRSAFRSGEKVTGWVTVETRGPVHALAYQVECLGFSEVPPDSGSTVPGAQKRPLSRRHVALKENLLPISRLVEKRSFEFQLPRWLPHSVEGEELGCVRYCCRAVAVFSGDSTGGDTIEATRYFTVIEDVDLNSPEVAQRCKFEETSCSSVERLINKVLKDEIKTSLVLKKDAYVPGENIYCLINVHSSSSVPVQKIVLRLVQRTTAIGGEMRQLGSRSRVIVQEQVTSDCQESGRYWSAKHKLHIPGVVPTSLANSHFQHPIVVEYAIQMCVTLGFTHVPVKDLTIGSPIVIGTVPKIDSPGQLTSIDASFVEASHCAIPNGAQQRERRPSKGSFLASFHSKRNSGYRSPQLQYTLYCAYYPTISIYRQKQSGRSLKSILKVKHSSIDGLDSAKDKKQKNGEQPPSMKRATSTGWYETPL